jgi:hypothetical protein
VWFVRLPWRLCAPSSTFYAELRAAGFRLTLGTYDTPQLAERGYDAAPWRL